MPGDPQIELRVSRLENDRESTYDLLTTMISTQQEHCRRFDLVDGRLDGVGKRLDLVDRRLDGVDKRLDSVDRRLDGVDKRFDSVDRRLGGVEAGLTEILRRLPDKS